MPMPTFTDGDILPASDLNELADAIDALEADMGTWQTYTPTDTNITVGNGTRAAQYALIGDVCHFSWSLVFGSTTDFTGSAGIGLPVPSVGMAFAFSCRYIDSGTRNYVGTGSIVTGTSLGNLYHSESGGLGFVTDTAPFTWTTSDSLVVSGSYRWQ